MRSSGAGAHGDNMSPVAVGMALDGGQQDAKCLLVAVGPVQGVGAVLGPARLPVVAAQHCRQQAPGQGACYGGAWAGRDVSICSHAGAAHMGLCQAVQARPGLEQGAALFMQI